jgi:hypothetical protein
VCVARPGPSAKYIWSQVERDGNTKCGRAEFTQQELAKLLVEGVGSNCGILAVDATHRSARIVRSA